MSAHRLRAAPFGKSFGPSMAIAAKARHDEGTTPVDIGIAPACCAQLNAELVTVLSPQVTMLHSKIPHQLTTLLSESTY
ncbi:MAG: hypothetical protein AAGF98_19840, partial [Cyanobacteria bacterium P01_H01_bin.153]